MSKVVYAYVPVLHAGYMDFFTRHGGTDVKLSIFGTGVLETLQDRPEIRALDPSIAVRMISALEIFGEVRILIPDSFPIVPFSETEFVLPNDDLCRLFAERHLVEKNVTFDTAFLRWDKTQVYSRTDVSPDRVSNDVNDQAMMRLALKEAEQASDWWRQVASVVVIDDAVVFQAHNKHSPNDFAPYMHGDPRDVVPAGQDSHLSSATHSEASVIGQAACLGIALKGASLYVTIFPCPGCARAIAKAGFGKCFFAGGHASLDGEEVLRSAGVELVLVKLE
jgi:dCMP deaminase